MAQAFWSTIGCRAGGLTFLQKPSSVAADKHRRPMSPICGIEAMIELFGRLNTVDKSLIDDSLPRSRDRRKQHRGTRRVRARRSLAPLPDPVVLDNADQIGLELGREMLADPARGGQCLHPPNQAGSGHPRFL